jgi:hypothetical protein
MVLTFGYHEKKRGKCLVPSPVDHPHPPLWGTFSQGEKVFGAAHVTLALWERERLGTAGGEGGEGDLLAVTIKC